MTKNGVVKRGREAALFRRRDLEQLELLTPPTLVVRFLPTSATTQDTTSASPPSSTIGEEEVVLYSVAKGFSRIVLDEEGQEQQQSSTSSSSQVQGDIIVTTKRLLFASRINEEKLSVPSETVNENAVWSSHDFVVDIQGIILHAIATDPEPSLYCQFEEEPQQPVTQVYFFPPTTSTCSSDPSLLLSKLFHALAMAIEWNPVSSSREDEDGLLVGEESDDSDYSIPIVHSTQPSDGATPEQRRAMLERLDALLVVPPDLEIHSDNDDLNGEVGRGQTIATRKRANYGANIVEGQFDDAEEDEEG